MRTDGWPYGLPSPTETSARRGCSARANSQSWLAEPWCATLRTSTGPGLARLNSSAWAAGSRSPSSAKRSAPAVTRRATLALFAPGVSGPSRPVGHSTSQDSSGPALRCSPGVTRSNGTRASAAQRETLATSPSGRSTVVVSTAPTDR